MMAPNICESTLRNFLRFTFWRLEFWGGSYNLEYWYIPGKTLILSFAHKYVFSRSFTKIPSFPVICEQRLSL